MISKYQQPAPTVHTKGYDMTSQFLDFIGRVITEIKDPLVRILRAKAKEFEDANETRKKQAEQLKKAQASAAHWHSELRKEAMQRKEEQAYEEIYAEEKKKLERIEKYNERTADHMARMARSSNKDYDPNKVTEARLRARIRRLENVIRLNERISKIVNETSEKKEYEVVAPEDIDLDDFNDINKHELEELYNPEAYAKCGDVVASTVVIDLWCRLNTDNEGINYLGKGGMERLREAVLLILANPGTPPHILLAENYVMYDADTPASHSAYPQCMCLRELRHLIYRFPDHLVGSYNKDEVRTLFCSIKPIDVKDLP